MNFNLEQGEKNSNYSVFDALSAFCELNMLEVKELHGSETAAPMRATLSDGTELMCLESEAGEITLTLRQNNELSAFTLIRYQQQWQILAVA